MKKGLISLVMLCAIIFTINIKAASVLEAKVTAIPPGGLLKANFIQQRHLTGIPKPILSEGQIILWSGKGLIWDTKTPFSSTILITPTGLYQVENNKKTVMMKTGQAGHDSVVFEIMGDVLSGNFSQGVKGFEIQTLPSQQNNWQIRLVPIIAEIKNFLGSIVIEGDKQISEVRIYRPNGDKDVIKVKDHAVFTKESISQAITSQQQAWFND